MDYDHKSIEEKWRKIWAENKTFRAEDTSDKPKYYVLDMFPYPSGAGLHVGHPLGYIASDIYARYKRHKGFNVLHPMGYDSFGLPAEQYAIQTGQHPAITTKNNIARYREQLDQIGFSFDWDREVRTSDPSYYKWTQWIFKQLYNSWYNPETDKAEDISTLKAKLEAEHDGWNDKSEKEQEEVLMDYRLTYLADTWVNWCPALGTVLANDEVKDGVSERGGHPVEQKLMRQWVMRITAYAERLLEGLDKIEWSDALKEQQRNWIGKSEGCSVEFSVDLSTVDSSKVDGNETIEVFTTRPDTIFGVSFMVLAPEHPLVEKITTDDQRDKVDAYVKQALAKTERDRQAEVKNITGEFTGGYAIHPFTGDKVPIWIGDYVLASYGTGAVMAVPAGDQRDWDFAKTFDIPIPAIFEGVDISEAADPTKDAKLINSDFLNGLTGHEAIPRAIEEVEKRGFGKGQTNYRLRDAVFSRQRYWGEPFPVYYEDDVPHLIEDDELPVELPKVDKYLPTEDGEPPLARATKSDWPIFKGDRMEYNTMPGWAGSSWYFLRYMDPSNNNEFCSREKSDYWGQVDLYIGGSEHATGHLLYARFWTKFLYDRGFIGHDEPFKKLINQGMILGRSSFVYRVKGENKFVSFDKRKDYQTTRLHADISMIDNDTLDVEAFKNWREEYADAEFILGEGGKYHTGHEVEKMSKSKYNVQTPDELVEQYGADVLRCYEMFLGPLEQSKPWDVQGISGVSSFLRKLWRLYHDGENFNVSDDAPSKESLKTLHKTIKKVTEDLERHSFNTVVSAMMIATNELTDQDCNSREVLEPLAILLSPYASHMAEELWEKLGHNESISTAEWPIANEEYLKEDAHTYPVSFNGKMRFKMDFPADMSPKDIEKEVLAAEQSQKWLEGKEPKKVIVVPKKIVNVVV